MTSETAAEIVGWSYPEPYTRYSLTGTDPAYFTDPANGFVALVDDAGGVVGYRSFGPDGQVPGGRYDESAVDTGGGLRPDLTGRGLGARAISLGLAYGWATVSAERLRVTVWAGNERALRVVRSLGFVEVDRFASTTTGDDFVVLVVSRPAGGGTA
jgi:RimJ/RimL family protein N-acetyltransferase